MGIEIKRGQEAFALLKQETLRENWTILLERCPWATAFQSYHFVSRWYETYQERFEPLLLTQLAADTNELQGLLTLAISRKSGQVVIAGAYQAEYQAWLAVPSLGNLFIEEALDALRLKFPGQTIVFKYIPPLAPREWLDPARVWGKLCTVESFRRPVLDVSDESRIQASLRKNHNKTPLKHLKRLGEVSFQRVMQEEELARVFEEIIANYDFRQGALNDVLPFQDDSLKKSFHMALLKEPSSLHVTLLKLNDTIIAANLGVHDGRTVHLGVFAYSPLFAKHSPGKLHLLLLAESMNREGFSILDLTPGGDWKDRLCSHHDEVYMLRVFLGRRQLMKHRIAAKGLELTKTVVQGLRLNPQSLREAVTTLRRMGVGRLFARVARRFFHSCRARLFRIQRGVYILKADEVDKMDTPRLMSRDSIGDLLAFRPGKNGHTRQDFLRQALQWLEEERHIYTKLEAGRLVHYAWLVERRGKLFSPDIQQEMFFPPDSAVLLDFYSYPRARSQDLCRESLRQMLHDAVEQGGAKQIFICGVAVDPRLRRAVEQLGFHRERAPAVEVCIDRS